MHRHLPKRMEMLEEDFDLHFDNLEQGWKAFIHLAGPIFLDSGWLHLPPTAVAWKMNATTARTLKESFFCEVLGRLK